MGIADRVSQATRQIQTQAQATEPATARHTVYWKPADLDEVRDFATPNFLSIADTIRGAVRFALAHEADFLDFLRQERLKK